MANSEKIGGGFANDTSGDFDSLIMNNPRGTRQAAAEAAARQEKRDGKKAEREKKTSRIKKVLGGAAIAAATAGVIMAADKEPNKPMPKEAWEDTMRKEVAGHNADFSYGEDGSMVSFTDTVNNEKTMYYLIDEDNDAYIERAHTSNSAGGASFETDGDGVEAKIAINILNEKMHSGE